MAEPIDPGKTEETLRRLAAELDKINPALADLVKQSLGLTAAHKQHKRTIAEQDAQVKDSNRELKDLNKSFKDNKKTYGQTLSDLNRLNNSFNSLDDEVKSSRAGMQMNTRINQIGSKLMWDTINKGLVQGAGTGLTSVMAFLKNQIMTGVRGLQGEGSATQVAAELLTSGIDSAASAAGAISGVAKGVGNALMAIPHPAAQVSGALLGLASDIFNAGAKQAAEIAKFAVEVVSKELENTTKSFTQATSAGALFANGLTGLRTSARDAGLRQEQFSKIIADNSRDLASFGGSVTAGAQKLGAVTKSFGDGTKMSLLKLGISIDEQAQGTSEYMAMLQQTGQLRGKSDKDLADGAANYLVNMKALSALTGEDAKAAAKRAKDAAMQAAVRNKLDVMGGQANEKFQNVVKGMPESFTRAAQQILQFGDVVDPDLAATLGPETMGVIKRAVAGVGDSSLSAADAIKSYQADLKATGPAIKAEGMRMAEAVGQVNLATGGMAEKARIAGDMMTLGANAQNMSNENTIDLAKNAATTQDDLTNKVAQSSVALQNMRVELQDRLTPAITSFANMVPSILKNLQAQIDVVGDLLGQEKRKRDIVEAERNRVATGSRVSETGGGAAMLYPTAGRRKPRPAQENTGEVMGEYANGGIASGPKSGFLANLHGTEAVVPLPDGNTIPVKIDAGSILGTMQNPMDKLAEGISNLLGTKTTGDAVTTVASQAGPDMTSLLMQFNQNNQEQIENQKRMIGILENNVTATERLLNAVS